MKSNNYIVIKCTDSGAISLKKDLTYTDIEKFLKNKDEISSFNYFLQDIIPEKEKIAELTEKDFYDIANYYAKYLELADSFNNIYKKLHDTRKAFQKTVKEYFDQKLTSKFNPFFQSIKQLQNTVKSVSIIKNDHFLNSIGLFKKNINMFNNLGGISKSFLEKNTIGGISKSFLEKNTIGGISKSFIKKNSLGEISKGFLRQYNAIGEISKSFFDKYNALGTISKSSLNKFNLVFKDSFSLINSQNKNYLNLSNSINIFNENFVKKEFDLIKINSFIGKSNKFIINTNNYFITKQNSDKFSHKEKEISKDLESNLDEAEVILYNESKEVIINTNELVTKKELKDAINELKVDLRPYKLILERINILFNPVQFVDLLKRFAVNIAKETWRIFWKKVGDEYVNNPEQTAKGLLSSFLDGHFLGISFIGKEVCSGNGYIDILVNFLGIDHIIELKILGLSWSISWVESGIGQLFNYMDINNVTTGYLVVFDGRKTDKGKKMETIYKDGDKMINVIIVKIYFN